MYDLSILETLKNVHSYLFLTPIEKFDKAY